MRKLKHWIDGFEQWCENRGSPEIFVRWTGIFTIAAAMERKVFVKTGRGVLYPNLYVINVGPPGAGKTQAVDLSRVLLEELKEFHLAPTSVTKASLIDALFASERHIIRPGETPPMVSFNSLTVTSNELGTFLPAYESDFMSVLTDIWDCKVYSETRRTSKTNIKIPRPQLSMISGTTPSYLTGLLPEGAWDQGFMSRTMLVYSGAGAPTDLFTINGTDDAMQANLIHDLQEIHRMFGAMEFTPEAAEQITQWHLAGGPPAPDHPKLSHYNTRRTQHLLKLCMVACAAHGDELLITVDHYVEALDWLISMEETIPDIFKSMRSAGDSKTIEEAYYFVYKAHLKEKAPVSERRLAAFVSERTPAHNVMRILEVMVKAGLLEEKMMSNAQKGYTPGAKG